MGKEGPRGGLGWEKKTRHHNVDPRKKKTALYPAKPRGNSGKRGWVKTLGADTRLGKKRIEAFLRRETIMPSGIVHQ